MNRVVLKVLCEWVVLLTLWHMHSIKQDLFERLNVWHLLLRDNEGLTVLALPFITSQVSECGFSVDWNVCIADNLRNTRPKHAF